MLAYREALRSLSDYIQAVPTMPESRDLNVAYKLIWQKKKKKKYRNVSPKTKSNSGKERTTTECGTAPMLDKQS